MRIESYSAFIGEQATGNQATVFIANQEISQEERQRLANENGAPTSAFVHPAATARVHLHTPTQQIEGCGHAWMAAACALATHQNEYVTFDVGHGRVSIAVHHTNETTLRATTTLPRANVRDLPEAMGQLLADEPTSPRIVTAHLAEASLRHLFIELEHPESVDSWSPPAALLEGLKALRPYDTLATFARTGSFIRMRDFCLPIGDYEEAASGTTSAALATLLELEDLHELNIRQGSDDVGHGSIQTTTAPAGIQVHGTVRRTSH